MNTNPKMDIGNKTVISCMIMTPIENTLKKGQQNGDATKVVTTAEIESVDIKMPTIDADVKSHEVSLDSGKNKKRRELQKAIIREQKETEKDLSEGR